MQNSASIQLLEPQGELAMALGEARRRRESCKSSWVSGSGCIYRGEDMQDGVNVPALGGRIPDRDTHTRTQWCLTASRTQANLCASSAREMRGSDGGGHFAVAALLRDGAAARNGHTHADISARGLCVPAALHNGARGPIPACGNRTRARGPRARACVCSLTHT